MNKVDKIKNIFGIYREFARQEVNQTKDMLVVFRDLLHKQLGGNKNPSEKEIQDAIEQLKDVGKLSALIPLAVLPGSVITIPLLVKIGKKYDIDILPRH